jgi:hypothetical protein
MSYLRIITIANLLLALALLNTSCHPAVIEDYQDKTGAKGDIEKKYTAFGTLTVNSKDFTVNESNFKNIKIWYPADLETTSKEYPVVVFANGTGIPNSAYEEVFKHLASWGFIAIGNNDKNSWSGYSSDKTLALLLAENSDPRSIFYQKVNTQQIGLSGHSQGGAAVINAYGNQPNGKYYRSIFGASTVKHALAIGLKWPYDVSRVTIPYFAVAGTGSSDAGKATEKDSGIAPLASMIENYDKLPSSTPTVRARRKDTEHGEMLYKADGYMTAWFFYTLLNDSGAGKAFTATNPEIQHNSLWQDVAIKNLK